MRKIIFSMVFILILGSVGFYVYNSKNELPAKIRDVTPQSLVEKCKGSAEGGEIIAYGSRMCYMIYFKEVMIAKGPKFTIDRLVDWAKITGGLAGECHNVGHELGQYAWIKYGMKSFEGDATACAFSYGHGILQSATKELPRETIVKKFKNICQGTKDIPGCLHGIGHALLDVNFTAKEASDFCVKEAKELKEYKVGTAYMTLPRTCMEGWAMEDFGRYNDFWLELDNLKGAIDKCEGVTELYTLSGCVGSEARNYIVEPDLGVFGKGWFEERVKRLNEYRAYCETQTNSDLKLGCANYLGLTGAEVYTLDLSNEDVAPEIEKLCNGVEIYCLSPFLNSRFNRFGNSDDSKIRPICAMFAKRETTALCNKVLDGYVAESR